MNKTLIIETKMSLCVPQRNIKSDPEAVKQVARATNNLLDNLGSLTVEVRHSPETPDMMSLILDRRVLQWTVVSCGEQMCPVEENVSCRGQTCPPACISSSLGPLGLLGSVSVGLCVQMKAVFLLQQRQTRSQLNKDSNVSAGFHFTENWTNNKQSTLICVLLSVPLRRSTLQAAFSCPARGQRHMEDTLKEWGKTGGLETAWGQTGDRKRQTGDRWRQSGDRKRRNRDRLETGRNR